MKKYLFVAAALLSLGACSKVEIDQNENHSISFGTYVPTSKAAAGAVVDGTAFAASAHINVYAWNTGSTAFAQSATAPAFMNATDVTLSATPATTASAEYSPIKFWPGDEANNKLSFIAYYPVSFAPGFTGADDVATLDVTVPAASDSQLDYMVADIKNDQAYSTNNGVVDLKFHHLMSQIKVKVNTDAATDVYLNKTDANKVVIKVKSITFNNILKTGTYTTTYAGGTSTHTMVSKGTDTESYVFLNETAGFDIKGTSTTAAYVPSMGTADGVVGDSFMLVPQTLATGTGAQSVTVVYTVEYTDGTPVETNTITKELKTAAVGQWAQNQKITYTFTIGLHPIQFTASAEDWSPKDTVENIVI